ncbi:MAG: hypothetical protein ACI901_002012, partial [Octadecabacter sp.]
QMLLNITLSSISELKLLTLYVKPDNYFSGLGAVSNSIITAVIR